MALQVWLPLNGNLNNQGIASNLSVTTIGTINYDNNGKIGKCFISGGTSQVTNGININSNLVNILNSANGSSIALWVKPIGNHVHYNGTFISSGNWNSTCWSFGVSQDNTKVDVLCKGYNQYITCSVPVNVWTHLTCTFKNGTSKLYKNGIYIGELTGKPAFASDASNVCIGRETYGNGYFGFNGRINDVRIYDHCLNPQEVKEIAKGLVLHYKLDNLLNNKIYDCSGYLNNGTITGALNINNDSPRYNYSTRFNGSSNKIMVPFNYQYYGNNFTICAWVKSNVNNGGYLTAIGNELSNGGIVFGELGAINKMNCYLNATNGQDICVCSYNSFEANKWYHVIYSVSNALTSPTTILYINGVQISTNTSSSVFGEPDQPIYIGCNGHYRYWNGQISDFRIYTTTLSADDIKELYNMAAYITDNGRIMEYKLLEKDTQMNTTSRGIIECKNFYENVNNINLEFYEYLENTSSSYIDTNYVIGPNNLKNMKLYCDFIATDTQVGNRWWAQGLGGGGLVFYVGISNGTSGTTNLPFVYGNGSSDVTTTVKGNLNVRYKYLLDLKNKTYVITDTSDNVLLNLSNITVNNPSYSYSPYIFGWRRGTNGNLGSSHSDKIYSYKLYDNDILVRDMVPCKYNNEPGMWDLVEGKFYRNIGSGTFTLGPKIYNNERILETEKSKIGDKYVTSNEFKEL